MQIDQLRTYPLALNWTSGRALRFSIFKHDGLVIQMRLLHLTAKEWWSQASMSLTVDLLAIL
jgi:hypothetical protein